MEVTRVNEFIYNNLFTRLDGIGISINRYNRYHQIIFNEAVFNGETFLALCGDTNGVEFDDVYPYTTMGYDGFSAKVQPRFLNISFNYVHELGIFEKIMLRKRDDVRRYFDDSIRPLKTINVSSSTYHSMAEKR